jgi:hypothetical protein
MASTLNGLTKALTWNDYTTTKTLPPPDPSNPASLVEGAFTQAAFTANFSYAWDDKAKGYKIQDTIVVNITFDDSASWQANWRATQTQAVQDGLLKHEQGHYDIAALLGRDLYNALVKQEAQVYPEVNQGANAKAAANQTIADAKKYLQPTQNRYDLDTSHGQNPTGQSAWNGYISNAFGQSSSTFLQVLSSAGIQITP